MKRRRLLLAASALSTLTFCKKGDEPVTQPLPGNPKGTFYDAAVVPPPPPDAEVREFPANPKGTFYDAGLEPLALDATVVAADAGRAPADAARTPADAAKKPTPPQDREPLPLPGNPKGSYYDKDLKLKRE